MCQWYDQMNHVAPHFIILLIMPSASCDAHAHASGATGPQKSHVVPHFDFLGQRNAMV